MIRGNCGLCRARNVPVTDIHLGSLLLAARVCATCGTAEVDQLEAHGRVDAKKADGLRKWVLTSTGAKRTVTTPMQARVAARW